MAYIKTISELPKWFDISNYLTEQKSAEKLLEQIIYRKALFEYLTNKNGLIPINVKPSEDFYSFTTYFGSVPYLDAKIIEKSRLDTTDTKSKHYSHLQAIFNYAFNKIKVDPLINSGFGELKYNYEFCWLLYLKGFISEYLEYDYAPIKDVQLYEIGEKFSMLFNNMEKYLLSEFKEDYTETAYANRLKERLDLSNEGHFLDNYEYSNDVDELYEFSKQYAESLSSEDDEALRREARKTLLHYEREVYELSIRDPLEINPFISIDLSCSDAVLREHFNQWLVKQRASLHKILEGYEATFKIDKNIKNRLSVLNRLYSCNVLAYMDLILWSELTGNKIKLSVLAHALYPDGDYDSEFVRKILKPLANNLFIPSSKEILELMYLKNMEKF